MRFNFPPDIESTFPATPLLGVKVSEEIFLLAGPLGLSGIESPLLGVSTFFFLSDGGPNAEVFLDTTNPFYFPGVYFELPFTFTVVFFFFICLGFGFSNIYLASSSSFYFFANSISFCSFSNKADSC